MMKSYTVHMLKGVEQRNDLVTSKEHRATMLYVACLYGIYDCSTKALAKKGAKGQFKDWAEVQGTRLRWLASYLVNSIVRSPFSRRHELSVFKGLWHRVNGKELPEKPCRRPSQSSVESAMEVHLIIEVGKQFFLVFKTEIARLCK